jgi:hypothetical protein
VTAFRAKGDGVTSLLCTIDAIGASTIGAERLSRSEGSAR